MCEGARDAGLCIGHSKSTLKPASTHPHLNLPPPIRFPTVQAKLYAQMGNEALPLFLTLPRPDWAKVRWINIQGMSWDCILALALHFDLHPLAVEDCVHVPQVWSMYRRCGVLPRVMGYGVKSSGRGSVPPLPIFGLLAYHSKIAHVPDAPFAASTNASACQGRFLRGCVCLLLLDAGFPFQVGIKSSALLSSQ